MQISTKGNCCTNMKRIIANAIIGGLVGGIALNIVKVFIGGAYGISLNSFNWLPFGGMGAAALLAVSWEKDKNYSKHDLVKRVRTRKIIGVVIVLVLIAALIYSVSVEIKG